jgi:hypothetical protein
MPRKRKRSIEPIGPTNIPGEALDPRIPPDISPAEETPPAQSEHAETEEEGQARDSEQAFDRAVTRIPPG